MNSLALMQFMEAVTELHYPGATKLSRETRGCPFCGADPGLAVIRNGVHIVGCEAEDCSVNPQCSDHDLNSAWRKWNTRHG